MLKDHSSLSTKRTRPPNISLALASEKRRPSIQIEAESPLLDNDDLDDLDDTLQLSSSDSSAEPSPTIPALTLGSSDDDSISDDITKDLAELQQLRKSVQKNLKLRPIRSRGTLPKVDLDAPHIPPLPKSPLLASKIQPWQDMDSQPLSAISPTSSIESYFTPISETPHSAQFIGYTTAPSTATLNFDSFKTFKLSRVTTPSTSSTATPTPKAMSPLSPKSLPKEPPKPVSVPKIAAPSAPSPPPFPVPISAKSLYDRLISFKRPLLIDTRPPAIFLSFRIRHSINIAIPSLILKRSRKPGGGAFQTLDALRQFITTEQGKSTWDDLMADDEERWDGDVVLYDDEMNEKDRDNTSVTAWALVPVLRPLVEGGVKGGMVGYLEGGISKGGHDVYLETLIMTGDEEAAEVQEPQQQFDIQQQQLPAGAANVPASSPGPPGKRKPSLGAGLFQLDTHTAAMKASKKFPEIEPSSSTSSNPPSPPSRSPLPVMSVRMPSAAQLSPDPSSILMDPTPSPPPSTIAKLDTKSSERLANVPKLSLRTKPMRSATLNIPPALSLSGLSAPTSPSHLNLVYSSHSPPASARWGPPTSPGFVNTNDPSNYLTPYYTPPHTPGTPKPLSAYPPSTPTTPHTARPDLLDPPPSTDTESECAFPNFTVSTILPGFLYLGPELTEQEHVDELQGLGVRRILNIAAECDDDQGLGLKEKFEKYVKIPMRDTVEEENIARGVKEVCEILDDARLHSAPTYVHCKAGKSRSVTAVMAYLIHANHWTLSRAYAFVLERRKGISPNIGFVSELMTFEEQELGGKSVGVQPSAPAGMSQGDGTEEFTSATIGGGGRRGPHVRESLPPALGGLEGLSGGPGGPMSAGGLMDRVIGDSGQEMEIKDREGRYRHARRAPVDENTLQPMRRVSKAGLESSAYA
ncbi:hypothetical protein BDQ17DRAFT_1360370 [Cyathus striatus]|nr:hypothetical protein BDQ17DRAFT_1360370 [Cyathus striatus]